MRANRIGLGVTLALHALVLATLLSYEPARKALLAAAPIMVEFILPAKVEPPKPQAPAARPIPKPASKTVLQRPVEPPMLAAPAETPSAVVAPAAPQAEVVAPPAPLTLPVFNADYLDNPAPLYPPASRRLGEQGRGVLRVLVNVRGTAED